jgi:hypothetical protein
MKRIKILIVTMLLVSPIIMRAQDERGIARQDPEARKKIEAARIALITERLGLTPEQAEKFWPIYREFSQKRGELRNEMRDAKKDVDKDNPDPEEQRALIELGLRLRQRELDLERDYSDRMLRIISAQQILNLRNAEREFQRMIIDQLQQRRILQQRRENLRDNQRLRDRRNNN